MSGKIVLVDGNSLMHRAFHALPLLDNGEGVYTNAVYGFFSMLFKVLKDETPDMLAVAFDLHGDTFRHEEYKEYKAGRNPTPDELRPQFDLLKELLAQMNVAILSYPRYEADDMLGTMAAICEREGVESIIVTGDRDSFQLVGDKTQVLFTHKGISETERVTRDYLMDKYGLTPKGMIDLKGLMGDNSDNIPGIPGVGEKTALKLLSKYSTLDEALERGKNEEKGKLAEKLRDFAQQAVFSRKLATIDVNAPIKVNIADYKIHDMSASIPLLEKYKLKTLIQRLQTLPEYMLGETKSASSDLSGIAWQAVSQLDSPEQVSDWAKKTNANCAIAIQSDKITLADETGRQATVSIGRDLLSTGVTPQDAMKEIAFIWSGDLRKIVVNLKQALSISDTNPSGDVFDVSLADYAINAKYGRYDLDSLLSRYAKTPDDKRTPASFLFDIEKEQVSRMESDGVEKLYSQIELPLSYVLRDMEKTGFLVDAGVLRELGDKYVSRISELTRDIYKLAGKEFNINSPKQLGDIIFGEMGLTGGKKTSRGYSTSADILESISDQNEIVPKILEYRKYFKLNSTYIDSLLKLRGVDGRIRTSFDQTATATGRISSNEPNLQNIPVRDIEGREIRRAFIAGEGRVLLDCDYSQIELRILAHLSGDEGLIDAFRNGRDIHKATAAEVYQVPINEVTSAMRSRVKAVNFGIIYGISDFGLAKGMGVSRQEAADFIKRYFEKYPGVKQYMDDMTALGKRQGYVTTLFGRRRYLDEMSSSNYNTRAFGNRVALNSPIQGTSADIMKLGMIRAFDMLKKGGYQAKLILQVHDELIIESPESEAESAGRLLVDAMQGACELSVPLTAELSIGRDWHECKD